MISATPGTLVAVTAKPYRFVDNKTAEVKQGTSYRVYLVPAFESAPLELKADEATYQLARSLGMGAKVDSLIEIGARDNRVVYTCKGLELASSNGAKVAR